MNVMNPKKRAKSRTIETLAYYIIQGINARGIYPVLYSIPPK